MTAIYLRLKSGEFMFLVELLRYITGFAVFKGTGGFSERFINLCSVHEIPLWSVAYHDGYFTARTTIDGYRRIAVCARNSGVKIKKVRSVGLPFVLRKLRPRVGLAVGILFFVVCISVLSNRVWIVEISGNSTVAEDVILAATEKAGLEIGKRTDELNVVQLSLDTCEAVEELSWAAIRVNGCCVYIDVTQSTESPKIENKDGAYNIVSSKDAQLVILEPYRGTQQAKVFSSVLKGDVLIGGFAVNKDESVSLVHASGYAVGRTETEISSSVSFTAPCAEYIPVSKTYSLRFFGINLPIGQKPADFTQKFEHSKMLVYGEKTLPVGITVTQYFSKKEKNKKISPEKARLISAGKFMNDFSQFSKGKQIISSEISFSQQQSSFEAKGIFTSYENIGAEIPLEVTAEN